ncbi:hypothetical protein BAU15_00515 [Enterococcus sp. JM4C]|uniref:YesL family protein n=1 Tax=Candidatus Enterococcus huntleyi TaxID=1857217 RepID=UPI00137A79B6|nr:DUF624 domain-containing protein [Enterococcus sp. JM4C]KAF1299162.1 hypothetical protein BAU15_00515 [Enterococcus sp. JM4C]
MIQSIEKVNAVLIRFLQLIYLNFLWIVVTVLGLGIFTIGPATYAMSSIFRRWIRSKDQFPLTKTYFAYFKENYKESVFMSWIYIVAGGILTVDLMYVSNWYLRVLLFIICFFYVISLIYIFPIMAHYSWQGYAIKIKMAFLFGFAQLQYTAVYILFIGITYWFIGQFLPGIFTFVGSSFLIFASTWTALQVFRILEAESIKDVEHKTIIKRAKEKIDEKRKIFKVRS